MDGRLDQMGGRIDQMDGRITRLDGEMRDFRRATTRSFNAMREDISGLSRRVEDGFAQADLGFIQMRGLFDAAAAGQQHVVNLIQTLIEKDNGGER